MGWAQLGKQCAGCVSSTQPKQTGPLHTPACGTVGKLGWLMLAGLTAGPQKGCVSSLHPSYPWLRGSAAASSGSLGRRRAGECNQGTRHSRKGPCLPVLLQPCAVAHGGQWYSTCCIGGGWMHAGAHSLVQGRVIVFANTLISPLHPLAL